MLKHAGFIGLIISLVVSNGCRRNYMVSRLAQMSQGTMEYLKIVHLDGLDEADIQQRLRVLVASSRLASEFGLKKDRAYDWYMIPRQNARNMRAARFMLNAQAGREGGAPDFLAIPDLVFAPDKALRLIAKAGQRKTSLRMVTVATYKGRAVRLDQVLDLMLPDEQSQFLNAKGEIRKQFLAQFMTRFVASKLDLQLRRSVGAKASEVDWFEHAAVADRFLQAKFGFGTHGIYPTAMLAPDMTPLQKAKLMEEVTSVTRKLKSAKVLVSILRPGGAHERIEVFATRSDSPNWKFRWPGKALVDEAELAPALNSDEAIYFRQRESGLLAVAISNRTYYQAPVRGASPENISQETIRIRLLRKMYDQLLHRGIRREKIEFLDLYTAATPRS